MAVTATPIFVQTPFAWQGQITTANTNRDGSGTMTTVATGSTNGDKVEHIDIVATGTTTAGVVRLYIGDASAVIRLWKEILVTAITPSTSIAVWSASIDCSAPPNVLLLPTTWTLRASTHNSETFNVLAVGGKY